ncbi:hypothetical protein AMJ74_00900 [candidate division WOR_3 bacterium SM1_77]|jgi:hypothetical protein|uniref:Uncharacterized protein n=1 Tax=candidate division WOR_3 bacterium SM1_77 TaxID=1703778 RepID=A0A0S8K474_UNCW3|nr:MAG: hypothetical protein AMJ74_00900 [candidate division WOR_3 bacterium SM1_77]
MLRIATLLTIVACLTIIGCQPPEGMAGVTKEEFDALKTQVETLQTDAANMQAAMDSFIEQYNMHIEKHHKGGKTVPAPAPPPSKPPKEKVK